MNRELTNDSAVLNSDLRGAPAARQGTRWRLALGAALALCAPLAFAPSAQAVGAGNSGANGKSGESGGDEGIGSLPSMVGGPGPFTAGPMSTGPALGSGLSKLDAGAPNLWLEGPLDVLVKSIENAWGKGFATVQLQRGTTRARIYFHGQVKVAVDPKAFESGLVVAGVWISPAFQGAIASVEWNGNWSTPVVVGGNVDLPIAAAAHVGVFQDGGATLHLGAPKGHKQSTLAIQSQHGLLVFAQSLR